MVVLPLAKKNSQRHSRPLAPPGGARRVPPLAPLPPAAAVAAMVVSQNIPVPPPRPDHTLTSQSRPVRPPAPVIVTPPPPVVAPAAAPAATANTTPSSTTTTPSPQPQPAPPPPGPPVMELVSLPNNRKVTLTTPRPEPEREKNLYTEAPKKLVSLPQSTQKSPVISVISSQHMTSSTQQPQKNVNKQLHQDVLSLLDSSSGSSMDSIFCQDCGKCKCEACCRPRQLPQKWLCGGTCLCSKRTVVDTLSCMCCVKGLFYHCTKDDEIEIDTSFDPCSCHAGNHAAARWATLAALCPFIPCLIAYPVLGACAKVTEVIYAKCTASGCQCQRSVADQPRASSNLITPSLIIESSSSTMKTPPLAPEKRLLMEVKKS